MVDELDPRYDPEFRRRWMAMCCGLNLSKTSFLKKTGYKEKRVNHYQKGGRPPRDVISHIGRVLHVPKLWGWLLEEDARVFDGFDREQVEHFQRAPEQELRRRSNELGWWKHHGAPRKLEAARPPK